MAKCEASGDCSADKVASLKDQVAYWDNLDTQRDTALKDACTANRTSPACVAAVTDALKAVEYLRDPASPENPSSMAPGGYADMEMRLVNGRFGGLPDQDLATAVYAERLQTIALLSQYQDSVQAALNGHVNQSIINAVAAVLTYAATEGFGQNRTVATGGAATDEAVAGGCSFAGSTLVRTVDGFTAISEIRPGKTLVWSRDEQGREGYKLVLRQFLDRHPETVYLALQSANGQVTQTITTTLLHRVFAVLPNGASKAAQIAVDGKFYSGPIHNGVWIAVKDLKPGDKMLDDDGSWSKVVSVRVEAKPLDAYNLTVADFHTYFVKQAANYDAKPVWVHNVTCTVIPNAMEEKILFGEINQRGRLIGAHSGDVVSDGNYVVKVGSTNADGTINAAVQMYDASGTLSAAKNSTLFPPAWDYDQILTAIKQVGDGPTISTRQTDGATLHQGSVDGVAITVIKNGNAVTAGYPTGGNTTPPGGF
ncbi:polymorphic toxin-type HINT domain-containing protein [Rhizobium miluonense]|uniref:polymorphic toxin-type HINT domain-containing protein n=1 Tax=Rhizobium miluonense TaxID=411945 RepID=UPI003862076C